MKPVDSRCSSNDFYFQKASSRAKMPIPNEVKRLALAGIEKKVEAIQVLRRGTGMGLAEAKEIVEIIATGGYVELPNRASELGEAQARHIERKLAAIESMLNGGAVCKRLWEILQADEELLDIAQGTHRSRPGLMILTKRRLLFIALAPPVPAKVAEFPLDSIHLVRCKAGSNASSIKIWLIEFRRAEFTGMGREMAKSFAELLRFHTDLRIDELGKSGAKDYLEQLEALYENGIITAEELSEKKEITLIEIRRNRRRKTRKKPRPS